MAYQAFDVKRASPLLIGRLHYYPSPTVKGWGDTSPEFNAYFLLAGGIGLVLIVSSWILKARARSRFAEPCLESLADAEVSEWLADAEQGAVVADAAEESETNRNSLLTLNSHLAAGNSNINSRAEAAAHGSIPSSSPSIATPDPAVEHPTNRDRS
jgi:hypothetical protein